MKTTFTDTPVKWTGTARIAGGALELQQVRDSGLTLEISRYRFRFCVTDESSRQCIWLEDFASETFLSPAQVLEGIRLLMFDHPVLSQAEWKKIRISVDSHAFTLIPESLFRKEYVGQYLRMVLGHPVLPADKILYHRLPELESYQVFLIPSGWWEYFQDHFVLQDVAFYDHTVAVLAGIPKGAATELTVVVDEEYLTLALRSGHRLLFCNRFSYANAQEAAFFVLSSLNQLHFLPEETLLMLYGEITPFSELYTEFSRFLPHIRFGEKPQGLNYIKEFEELADHRYFTLLSAARL